MSEPKMPILTTKATGHWVLIAALHEHEAREILAILQAKPAGDQRTKDEIAAIEGHLALLANGVPPVDIDGPSMPVEQEKPASTQKSEKTLF